MVTTNRIQCSMSRRGHKDLMTQMRGVGYLSLTSTENGERGASGNGGQRGKKATDAIKEKDFKKTSGSPIKSKKQKQRKLYKEKVIKLMDFFEKMDAKKLLKAQEAASTSTASIHISINY